MKETLNLLVSIMTAVMVALGGFILTDLRDRVVRLENYMLLGGPHEPGPAAAGRKAEG